MITNVVTVGWRYVYDLYYRTQNNILGCEVYAVDFMDWIKAGLAQNPMGVTDPTLQPHYFGKLYQGMLKEELRLSRSEFRMAVTRHYSCLFQLYQYHLRAELKAMSRKKEGIELEPKTVLFIPTFKQIPVWYEDTEFRQIKLSDYNALYPEELLERASSGYLVRDSLLFRGMALVYDYGEKREDNGILLEVI